MYVGAQSDQSEQSRNDWTESILPGTYNENTKLNGKDNIADKVGGRVERVEDLAWDELAQ